MKTSIISRLSHRSWLAVLVWAGLLVGLALPGRAAVYYWTDGFYQLQLNIPESVSSVRGIFIYGNGGNQSRVQFATNAEIVAIAESIDFAVLATGFWYDFSDPEGLEFAYFEQLVAAFANATGHPEMADAPWLPYGNSNGGMMAYGLAVRRPEKTIAFCVSKAAQPQGFYVTNPPPGTLRVPGLFVSGQNDWPERRVAIRTLYDNHRPKGALWAWTEEQNGYHDDNDLVPLKMPFLLECYRLRYPSYMSPTNGPVTLKDLNDFDGWLVDHNSRTNGLTAIYHYDEAPGDKLAYGWVPNEYSAKLFRAFSSYEKPCTAADGISGVRNAPTNLVYSLTFPNTNANWTKIEFFRDTQKIGEATGGGLTAAITNLVEHGGFNVFHALVTLPATNFSPVRTTFLRRVFVNGPDRLTPFQQWAATNLPPETRGPKDLLHPEDGIANLTRFVFNLGTNRNPSRLALPRLAGFTSTGGVRRALFPYRIGTAQRDSGVNVRLSLSTNVTDWSLARSPALADDPAGFWRSGDTNNLLLPESSQGFIRLELDDRF